VNSVFLIQTPRLLLREFLPDDALPMFELNNDPEVLKFTGDQPFSSLAEASSFLDNYDHYKIHGFGRWAVLLKESQQFIGWCGLKKNADHLVDLGFRFFREYWNQGYASEAAQACLDYGFYQLKLDEIIGRCSLHHSASARVLEKIGFRYWKDDQDDTIGKIKCFRITAKDRYTKE